MQYISDYITCFILYGIFNVDCDDRKKYPCMGCCLFGYFFFGITYQELLFFLYSFYSCHEYGEILWYMMVYIKFEW